MNRVIHFEVHATDTAKMADFYRTVFGWEIKKWDNPGVDYWIVMTGPDVEKGKPAPEIRSPSTKQPAKTVKARPPIIRRAQAAK